MTVLSLLLLIATTPVDSPPGWTPDTLLSLNDVQESRDPALVIDNLGRLHGVWKDNRRLGARTKSIAGAGTKSPCAGSGRELMARGFSASHPARFALLCGASEDESDWRSIGTFPLHRLQLRP